MTLEAFIDLYGSLKHKSHHLRIGQYMFISLHEVRPDLAGEILATKDDPFYDDGRLSNFWLYLNENWDK